MCGLGAVFSATWEFNKDNLDGLHPLVKRLVGMAIVFPRNICKQTI